MDVTTRGGWLVDRTLDRACPDSGNANLLDPNFDGMTYKATHIRNADHEMPAVA